MKHWQRLCGVDTYHFCYGVDIPAMYNAYFPHDMPLKLQLWVKEKSTKILICLSKVFRATLTWKSNILQYVIGAYSKFEDNKLSGRYLSN